ncbi:hypothetical protein D9M68_951650 [compost metagenome]
MGRHRSTIYRKIKRNSFRDTDVPDYNGYHSVVADNISKERRTQYHYDAIIRMHVGSDLIASQMDGVKATDEKSPSFLVG